MEWNIYSHKMFLEVLEMREEEVFSKFILDIDESFVDLDIEDQPPGIDKVGCYNGTCLSTFDTIVTMQHSIAQVAPQYAIPFDKFEALQAKLFGP